MKRCDYCMHVHEPDLLRMRTAATGRQWCLDCADCPRLVDDDMKRAIRALHYGPSPLGNDPQ